MSLIIDYSRSFLDIIQIFAWIIFIASIVAAFLIISEYGFVENYNYTSEPVNITAWIGSFVCLFTSLFLLIFIIAFVRIRNHIIDLQIQLNNYVTDEFENYENYYYDEDD